ncbi:hypothetical protein U1Q18_040681 [Sarracenia purpurea var. burkii]
MKLVMDLYKQMQVEGNPMGNYENRSREPLAELFPEEIDRKGPSTGPISTVEKLAEVQPQGSYVVGGSVVGWNFITFSNRKPNILWCNKGVV